MIMVWPSRARSDPRSRYEPSTLAVRGISPGGYVSSVDRRAVEVHMANLRHKLHEGVGSPPRIETVRGVGYRLTGAQPQ
ncbi:MAG TPA: helix-turn-helix domain-containing protein [Microlunatus sp.]